MKTEVIEEMVARRTAFVDEQCAKSGVETLSPAFKSVIRGVLAEAFEGGFIAGIECESKTASCTGPSLTNQ